MITDEHLKTMITDIEKSTHLNMDLEKAMKNKLFKTFANKCLEIINPDIYYSKEDEL